MLLGRNRGRIEAAHRCASAAFYQIREMMPPDQEAQALPFHAPVPLSARGAPME